MRLIVTLALALGLSLAGFSTAWADGGAECGADGNCSASDNDSGGGGGSGGGGSSSDKPKYPQCQTFIQGIYVAVGERPEASGDELPPDIADYVHATCDRGDGVLQWVWFKPSQSPEQMARALLAEVQLEPIGIGMAPKAGVPVIVGMPVWLWADDPSRTTWGPATITAGEMTLTAEVESVTWDMGDGSKVSCDKGTKWNGSDGASPTCGYVYEKRGKYTVRATSHWVARWSGYGQSGTIPVTLSRTRDVEVDELQVIVTRG